MEKVFELFVRDLLRERLAISHSIRVLDGNLAPPVGDKRELFENFVGGSSTSPAVTPDIVAYKDSAISFIADVKYKPAPALPDRGDLEQVVCYGARYNCERILLLYPSRKPTEPHIHKIGRVGRFWVYIGRVDLGSGDMLTEESDFVASVGGLA